MQCTRVLCVRVRARVCVLVCLLQVDPALVAPPSPHVQPWWDPPRPAPPLAHLDHPQV